MHLVADYKNRKIEVGFQEVSLTITNVCPSYVPYETELKVIVVTQD